MNTESIPAVVKPAAQAGRAAGVRTGGFYESIVFKSLEPMTLGCLRLQLPDGSQRMLGRADAEICAQVRIVNPAFFKKCVLYGDVGFGEAYVDGDWETDDITRVISWFILNVENAPGMSGSRSKKM